MQRWCTVNTSRPTSRSATSLICVPTSYVTTDLRAIVESCGDMVASPDFGPLSSGSTREGQVVHVLLVCRNCFAKDGVGVNPTLLAW